MKTIKMIVELTYDDEIMHSDDKDGIDWFSSEILMGKNGSLLLHSSDIGDVIGSIEGIEILK